MMAKRRSSNHVAVDRARGGQGWVLTHPRDVLECAEDLEEVRAMIAAGESEQWSRRATCLWDAGILGLGISWGSGRWRRRGIPRQ